MGSSVKIFRNIKSIRRNDNGARRYDQENDNPQGV